MGKLLELLNEYETPQSWVVFKSYDNYDGTFYWVDCDGEIEIAWSDAFICSKKFWFIQRLVENDKIDTIWGYKTIIKWLSISDTPIEDLISYLK